MVRLLFCTAKLRATLSSLRSYCPELVAAARTATCPSSLVSDQAVTVVRAVHAASLSQLRL